MAIYEQALNTILSNSKSRKKTDGDFIGWAMRDVNSLNGKKTSKKSTRKSPAKKSTTHMKKPATRKPVSSVRKTATSTRTAKKPTRTVRKHDMFGFLEDSVRNMF